MAFSLKSHWFLLSSLTILNTYLLLILRLIILAYLVWDILFQKVEIFYLYEKTIEKISYLTPFFKRDKLLLLRYILYNIRFIFLEVFLHDFLHDIHQNLLIIFSKSTNFSNAIIFIMAERSDVSGFLEIYTKFQWFFL